MRLRTKAFLTQLLLMPVLLHPGYAAEGSLPPTRVSGSQNEQPPAQDANENPASRGADSVTAAGRDTVSLQWLELELGATRSGVNMADEYTDGFAGRAAGQLLISEFVVVHFGGEQAIVEAYGQAERVHDQFFAGLAFAAPIGSKTRLLLESGWLREDFSQESTIRAIDQGVYAAVGLSFMLGRRFEMSFRSRGDTLPGRRRHDNAISLRYFATPSFSLGLTAQRRHTALQDDDRLYLSSRWHF